MISLFIYAILSYCNDGLQKISTNQKPGESQISQVTNLEKHSEKIVETTKQNKVCDPKRIALDNGNNQTILPVGTNAVFYFDDQDDIAFIVGNPSSFTEAINATFCFLIKSIICFLVGIETPPLNYLLPCKFSINVRRIRAR